MVAPLQCTRHVHASHQTCTRGPRPCSQYPCQDEYTRNTGVSQAPRREPPQPPVNNAAAKKLKPTQLYIQAGAFLFIENAERLQERVAILAEASVAPAKVNGREWFRVRVGPLTNLAKADETLERLIDNGHINARIIVE